MSVYNDRATKDDIHVTLHRRKESLQPFIRGGVRKVASEDLMAQTLSF